MSNTTLIPAVSSDQALSIAQADAVRVYRDLTQYSIRISLESEGWHVDYEVKSSGQKGGGPRYIIDATTGTILEKKYYQ